MELSEKNEAVFHAYVRRDELPPVSEIVRAMSSRGWRVSLDGVESFAQAADGDIVLKVDDGDTPLAFQRLEDDKGGFDALRSELGGHFDQETMKCDMGGSAAVLGVMSAVEKLGINVTVHGIFAAAENMLGADAYKLGDVLTYRNGKTVEIHNTDAEGRLLLADCLCLASEMEGVTHIVDLATLTGAAVVALGEKYTALYANDQDFADALLASAKESGEGLWQMPLENDYNALLKADIAHIKNVGGRAAGSITAALYLQNFVADGKTWAHMDIAGPAFLSKPTGHLDKGGAGPQVVTLLNWLSSL